MFLVVTVFQFAWGDSRLYDWCVSSVNRYCVAHGLSHRVLREPRLRIAPDSATSGRSREATSKHGGFLPIFEKENGFEYLKVGPVLILDADVWIRPGAPNIFDELGEAAFAGVPERDMPSTPKHSRKVANYSRTMFGPLDDVDWRWDSRGADFYNMGVMLCGKPLSAALRGQSPGEFLRRPEFKRFVDGVGFWKRATDQVLLNWWLRREGVDRVDLGWKWNCLFSAVSPEKVKEAHFVHFFLRDHLPSRGENVKELAKLV